MGVSAKRLYGPDQLGNTVSTLYTSPAGTTTSITTCVVNNVDPSVQTYTIHVVPSGDTADATNMVVDEAPLDSGENEIVGALIAQILQPGDSIQALASAAASVNILISGNTIT